MDTYHTGLCLQNNKDTWICTCHLPSPTKKEKCDPKSGGCVHCGDLGAANWMQNCKCPDCHRPPQESEGWKKDFYVLFSDYKRKENVRVFIQDLLSHQLKELRGKADYKLTELLNEFANTPLDKRGNGWDWLLKARALLQDLEIKP